MRRTLRSLSSTWALSCTLVLSLALAEGVAFSQIVDRGGPTKQPIPPPTWRFSINNLLVLRLNPVGLEDQMRIGASRKLFEKPGPLFRDTFFFFGLAPRVNPAFVKIGPSVEFQPLSIFNLRVTAEFIAFFSTFNFLQSYTSAHDEYHDTQIRDCASTDPMQQRACVRVEADGRTVTDQEVRRNYKAIGAHVMIEPTIQFKMGPIAFRNKLGLEYWAMGLQNGDRLFYDVTLDTLVPTNGWVLANDMDLLFTTRFGLNAGVRYSLVKPFYTENDYRPGQERNADNSQHRMGPILAYTFFDRGYTRFNKPTILLIANWYLGHRYRTGVEPSAVLPGVFVNSAGMPYLILGFSFQSDLLPYKRPGGDA